MHVCMLLDFAKAFNKVPHKRLIKKLRGHGIDGRLLDWISNWLNGRKQRVCLRGAGSSWSRVTSGVPQGSVLGPVLFLVFINDLDAGISSSILKFADDTKLFSEVNSVADAERLQQDLNKLQEWAKTWQMQFNASKCKVIHFGGKNPTSIYTMNGHTLEETSIERDLGIQISSNLKASQHCLQAYSNANRMLGLMKRTFVERSPGILTRVYKSIVRPHLEYSISAWNPHYRKDKDLLEKVQHRFTRLFPGYARMPYEERLKRLELWTLEERRNRNDLVEVYKILNNLTSSPALRAMFRFSEEGRTRGHHMKLMKNRCNLEIRRHFFSERVINRWNSLPLNVVASGSLNVFKKELTSIRETRMDFFYGLNNPPNPSGFILEEMSSFPQVWPHLVSYLVS